MFYFETN